MANEYKLRTIKDIWDKVPADRIQDCLTELGIMMATNKGIAETMKEISKASNLPQIGWDFPEEITWTDDGKGHLETHFGEHMAVNIDRDTPGPTP